MQVTDKLFVFVITALPKVLVVFRLSELGEHVLPEEVRRSRKGLSGVESLQKKKKKKGLLSVNPYKKAA